MKLLKIFLFILIALICLSGCKNKNTTGDKPVVSFSGKVIQVLDGDTLKLEQSGTVYKIRLSGIDAPEKTQAYGKEAKAFLCKLAERRNVTAIVKDRDKYGRYIATVMYQGIDVNSEMLRAGLAWHYARYDDNPYYAGLMAEARKGRVGLWQDAAPVMPETFRRSR